MKERVREEIAPLNLMPGNTIELSHNKTVVLREVIGRTMVIDTVVVFDIEEGDFDGATDGIGGAFLVTKKEIK